MSFIRGKIESEREIVPRTVTYGKSSFYQCEECGKYFDCETNMEIEVEVKTLKELMDEIGKCGRHKAKP